jgi:hypothetical protein
MNPKKRITLAKTFAAVLILSNSPAVGSLYSENFELNPAASWVVNDPGLSDILANFHYDYSQIGVPSAPNGIGTRGLKLTANNSGGVFSGFSVSPNVNFSGNYVVRFDLWQNYVGPLGVGGNGSTQLSMFGIGTAGNVPMWPGLDSKESVTFAVTLDGGSASDYRAYSSAATTSYPAGSSVYHAPGGAINASDAYYSGFGGELAPAAQLALFAGQTGMTDPGEASFAWRRVEIKVQNDLAHWSIDGLPIATVDLSSVTLGGERILFGHSDTNTSSSTDPNASLLNVTLIDNILVFVPEPSGLTLSLWVIFGWLGSRRRR